MTTSLVNLDGLSKPATVLVEKICGAVGGVFRPLQIVLLAKAEAKADLIRAHANIEITDLERRAFRRMIEEEAIKQNNMENIIRQALPQVNKEASPEDMEDDWIAHFFEQCRLTSDSQMQLLWARLLSGQANSPAKYSKRTVAFLSALDRGDALLFSELCRFCWGPDDILPLVYDSSAEVYNKCGLKYETLNHLDSIGLITFGSIPGFEMTECPETKTLSYHNTNVTLSFKKGQDNTLSIGQVLLTKVGTELATLCDPQPVEGLLEYISKVWKTKGYQVSFE